MRARTTITCKFVYKRNEINKFEQLIKTLFGRYLANNKSKTLFYKQNAL